MLSLVLFSSRPRLFLGLACNLSSAAIVTARGATMIAASLVIFVFVPRPQSVPASSTVLQGGLFSVKEIKTRLLCEHLHVSKSLNPGLLEPDPSWGSSILDNMIARRWLLSFRIHGTSRLLKRMWGCQKHHLFDLITLSELLLDLLKVEPLHLRCLRASLNPFNHLLWVTRRKLMYSTILTLRMLIWATTLGVKTRTWMMVWVLIVHC